MLVYSTRLIGTAILSVQAGGPIGSVSELIVNPDNLQLIALRLAGPLIPIATNLLDISSVREYSNYGMVIDSIDELIAPDDVVKIQQILELNFNLIGLKVETKKGSKLGQVSNYTINSDDFSIQQIIVQRPALKRLIDPELTISRREIIEITDYKIIVKDEEATLKKRAEHEDFIPNFVNPFRKSEQEFAPADTNESKHNN